MAGFQNFTPRTANLAKVWEGFNPAANFLGGMKAVQQMDLDAAVEERLRESAEVDRLVKTTMLPYEERLANARIGATNAQASYYASRAEDDAEDLFSAAVFSDLSRRPYSELKEVLKGNKPTSPENTPSSPSGRSFSLGGGDVGFSETLIDDQTSSDPTLFDDLVKGSDPNLFDKLGVTKEELYDPKYAMVSSPTGGVSTDAPPNNEAMQILGKRKANGALLGDQQSKDLKEIRSNLYKDSNPLLNMEELLARKAKGKQGSDADSDKFQQKLDSDYAEFDPPSLGRFISDEYSFIQEQDNLAALLPKKSRDKAYQQATVQAMKGQFNLEAAKKFGISPAAVPMLVYSSRGVLRSPEEIDQIHGAMKIGYVDLPDEKGQLQRYEVKSPEDAVALTEKQRMTPINRIVATKDDSTENYQKAVTTAKTLHEMASNTEDPDRSERYRREADALINNYVPSEVRQQMYIQDQANIFTGINPTSWTDASRNYKGLAISKEMPAAEKITTAERFNKEAGRAFPVVSGKVVGGELDVDDADIAAVSAWFQQKGLPVPEGNFFAGVRIKTDKGLEAYPVQLNLKTKGAFTMVNLPSQSVTPKSGSDPALPATKFDAGAAKELKDTAFGAAKKQKEELEVEIALLDSNAQNIPDQTYVAGYAGAGMPVKVNTSAAAKQKSAQRFLKKSGELKSRLQDLKEKFPELFTTTQPLPARPVYDPDKAPGDPEGKIKWEQ